MSDKTDKTDKTKDMIENLHTTRSETRKASRCR